MTNTKIINAGALATAGSDLSNATKVTLPASTKQYTLEIVITNGAIPASNNILKPEIRFATSNVDGVAATIAEQLALHSQFRKADIKSEGLLVTHFTTPPFVPTGSLLYVWVSHPKLAAAASIDVWLNTVDEAAGIPITPPTPGAATAATFVRGLKAPASTAAPEALAAAGTYVQTVTVFAQRAARVANASSVFVDSTATNDAQLIELTPGGFVTFTAPPGKVIDLGDIYVDSVTLTDGVFFIGLL